jgi:hypothetical protein
MILEGTEYKLAPLSFEDWDIAEEAGYGTEDMEGASEKGLPWLRKAVKCLVFLSLKHNYKDITEEQIAKVLTHSHINKELLDFLLGTPGLQETGESIEKE